MKRPPNLIIAFSVSLALHVIVGVCAGNLRALMSSRMIPLFKEGESSVALTVVSVREIDLRPPEESGPPDKPEIKHSVLLEVRDRKDKLRQESVAENDADILVKGVETFSIGKTEIRPRYPLGSRLRGEEGIVTVNVRVGAAGRAEKVSIMESSGYPALDRAAVKAVGKALFITEDGAIASGGELVLSFRFKLID